MFEIVKNTHFGRKAYDNAFGIFRSYLEYKTEEKGKKLIIIDRNYPSSRICNKCGAIKNDLKLYERYWICPVCSAVLDRDINAAINIKNEGLSMIEND